MSNKHMDTREPDYTIEVIKEAAGWIVYEGGKRISKPYPDEATAKSWAEQYRLWYQPTCLVCGSAIGRADDPWECVQASCSMGADYMHRSCMEKFYYWDAEERAKCPWDTGPHFMPKMDVIDAAWEKRKTGR